MATVVIFGATSAIAAAAAREWGAHGADLVLVGRDGAKLAAVGADLKARGCARCVEVVGDLGKTHEHAAIWARCLSASPAGFDVALVAYGSLPDQGAAERDPAVALGAIETNFTSVVGLLTLVSSAFEAQGRGTIAVISSVAGDRGRQSNYIYGAAKGGLSIFLAGLRNRLFRAGVHVVTVKPGFVATPMTAHLQHGPLFASADGVGRGIVRACEARRDVVYLPWFWAPIRAVMRAVPECIFKRLRL